MLAHRVSDRFVSRNSFVSQPNQKADRDHNVQKSGVPRHTPMPQTVGSLDSPGACLDLVIQYEIVPTANLGKWQHGGASAIELRCVLAT
jgi:hypothetical protein